MLCRSSVGEIFLSCIHSKLDGSHALAAALGQFGANC